MEGSPFVGHTPAPLGAGGTNQVTDMASTNSPQLPQPGTPLSLITSQWCPLPASSPSQVGGHLYSFLPFWHDICTFQAVLDLISGVRLEFYASPPLTHHSLVLSSRDQ